MRRIEPGTVVKHFKGSCYRVLAYARHTETNEIMVVYQALYGENEVFARPLDMFMGKVDKTKYPQANQEHRFETLKYGLQGYNQVIE